MPKLEAHHSSDVIGCSCREQQDLRCRVCSTANNSISDAGRIARYLKRNAATKVSLLDHNTTGDTGCAALVEPLTLNASITEINLTNNSIGGVGGTALLDGQKTNSTYVEVRIDFNHFESGRQFTQ